ncbi:hypothetical protein H4Q32_011500 [Labeo rohita]|uniref:Reverse transcriptase domain-containing protein n=1 Tax=Labeo rohita TaxID=84645 RepID=A0ABQ8LWE9_LABRO|nr:hypothetical protein H4Q32_011500 [Labeo rohita]
MGKHHQVMRVGGCAGIPFQLFVRWRLLGKIVHQQLQSFLDDNMIFEKFQYGFRKHHFTQTALLNVLETYMTAAFDTVDHAALIAHLELCAGIKGSTLDWFQSYFSIRSFFS